MPLVKSPWVGVVEGLVTVRMRRGNHKNPKPNGSIQPGSTTDELLAWLKLERNADRWWTRRQVMHALMKRMSAVDHALEQLERMGRIECSRWPEQYRRPPMYRLKREE